MAKLEISKSSASFTSADVVQLVEASDFRSFIFKPGRKELRRIEDFLKIANELCRGDGFGLVNAYRLLNMESASPLSFEKGFMRKPTEHTFTDCFRDRRHGESLKRFKIHRLGQTIALQMSLGRHGGCNFVFSDFYLPHHGK